VEATSSALPSDLDDEQRVVAMAVQSGCRYPDDICEKTGLTAHGVAAALLTLSLRHVLVQGSDGQAHLATCRKY
jgi:hypothetical protein